MSTRQPNAAAQKRAAASMSSTLQSICSEHRREWCTSMPHHLHSLGAELAVDVPLRPLLAVGEFMADFVQRLGIFNHAREIPVRIEVVLWRVVAMRGVVRQRGIAGGGAAFHLVV